MEISSRLLHPSTMIQINSNLSIPKRELQFTYSTSSGPGGQHANKVATRVTLLFDVHSSPSLSSTEKQRIAKLLATRLNKLGVLRVVSSRHRSQRANLQAVIERFAALLGDALHIQKRRRKSRVPAAARRKRMEQKRKRSGVKQLRKRVRLDEARV